MSTLRPTPSSRAILCVLAGVVATTAIGCGGQKLRDGFVEMYGTVTMDKEPLADAQVEIVTEKGTSYGRTDSSGQYVAEYSDTLKGAGKGPAKVRIRTSIVYPGEDTSGLKVDPRTGDFKKEEKVPAKYNTKSELKIDIKDDGAPYNFDLTAK